MLTTNIFPLETYFTCIYFKTNNLVNIKINSIFIKKIIFFFKWHSNLLYNQLVDLSLTDYLERKFRFELFYNLLSIKNNFRLKLSTTLVENNVVDSISNIYPNAGWYEREAWDMFGIYFNMHTDLRRILTDYGFKGHPLRKDFPMTGYIEVRYDAFLKRIIYVELNLTQEFRIFVLNNSWGNFNLGK